MQETHRQIIRGFARQHALLGEAKAQNIGADTARVSARLQKLKQRYKSEEQFQKQLAKNNLTVDSIRSMLANQFRQQALQQQIKMGVRVEQQALAKHGLNYVIDEYLPRKLDNPARFLP